MVKALVKGFWWRITVDALVEALVDIWWRDLVEAFVQGFGNWWRRWWRDLVDGLFGEGK